MFDLDNIHEFVKRTKVCFLKLFHLTTCICYWPPATLLYASTWGCGNPLLQCLSSPNSREFIQHSRHKNFHEEITIGTHQLPRHTYKVSQMKYLEHKAPQSISHIKSLHSNHFCDQLETGGCSSCICWQFISSCRQDIT